MDLFGAATMGVDPKTGSYLSKEQRVAMFRASRGQGGSGGGGAKVPGGGTRATVDPKSSIVAVKKNMLAVVETLQKNYQEGAANVAEQVARNTQNINDINDSIHEEKKVELKDQQQLLEGARRRRGNFLQEMRENLVENISKVGAKIGDGAKALGGAAYKKTKGFLEKLRNAILLLGAAWVIDNLPAIETAFNSLKEQFEKFPTSLEELLKYTKGAWGFLDKIFTSARKFTGDITKKIKDVTKWILDKGGNLIKKLFNSVKNFVVNLVTKGVEAVKEALKGGADGATAVRDARRGTAFASEGVEALKSAKVGTKALPSGTKALPPASGGRTPTPKGNSLTRMWDSIKGFAGNTQKNVMEGLSSIKTSVSDNLKNLSVGKTNADGVKANWLTQALEPIAKVPGLKHLSKVIKGMSPLFKGMLKVFPPLSLAIDLAINKGLEGRNWTEAIIGALGSTLFGAGGAALGGKVGFGVGGAIGQAVVPIPGVGFGIGAAIGSALGAALMGMVAGQVGDELALRGAQATGVIDERTSAPTMGTSLVNAVAGTFDMTGSDAVSTLNSTANIGTPSSKSFDGLSTPAGMDLADAYGSDVQFIDMPPEMIDMSQSAPVDTEVQTGEAEDLRAFSTRDVDMDDYRVISSNEYQLAF